MTCSARKTDSFQASPHRVRTLTLSTAKAGGFPFQPLVPPSEVLQSVHERFPLASRFGRAPPYLAAVPGISRGSSHGHGQPGRCGEVLRRWQGAPVPFDCGIIGPVMIHRKGRMGGGKPGNHRSPLSVSKVQIAGIGQ